LTKQLGVPAAVCINKYDINESKSVEIENESSAKGIPVVGKIEYDKAVTDAQIKGVSLVEYKDNSAAKQIKETWRKVFNIVNTK
jgi:MinD superfamily P-loop ATPase